MTRVTLLVSSLPLALVIADNRRARAAEAQPRETTPIARIMF
jgi:hypothetical protein